MLDIRKVRHDFEGTELALARRGGDTSGLADVRDLDIRQRGLQTEADELRHQVKERSDEVGALHRDGKADVAAALQAENKALSSREKELRAEAEVLTDEIRTRLLVIPNLPADDCPDGRGEADNVEVRRHGFDEAAYGEHQRVPHWEIGEHLRLLDVERAVKMSGAMFVMYRGAGARLARSLLQLALDRNSDAFEEIRPPTLVLTDTMISTGHLPKFEEDAYHIERDDLWAIPTAEVPLTSLARDEILVEADLPMRMMAHTSCYRREAGSAGRDTRGLLRVHEFDKVEILAYDVPERAEKMHQELLERAESTIRELGLAYRILDLCTGDIGASAARTFDIEVYAPGADQWLEVSSVSWFSDYQARRANVRYKPSGGKKTEFVHTFNGSALAVPRVWAALVETHRQPDGSIRIPEILQPHFGSDQIPVRTDG